MQRGEDADELRQKGDDVPITVGAYLHQLRKQYRYSVRDVATQAQIAPRMVLGVEQGKTSEALLITRLAQVLRADWGIIDQLSAGKE